MQLKNLFPYLHNSEEQDLAITYKCACTGKDIKVKVLNNSYLYFEERNFLISIDDILWVFANYDNIFPDSGEHIRFLPRENGTKSGFHYSTRTPRISDEYYVSNEHGDESIFYLSEIYSLVNSILKMRNINLTY